ncbi:MAG: trigger factor [Planctomycetes bacterium]|nr:trigger factor [Planctomycetota bacterium]
MAEQDAGSVGKGDAVENAASGAQPEEQAAAAPEPLRAVASVEETGPCARLVKVEVPQARVHQEIEKSYAELRKTVSLKGFRPGHIPRHVLERRFGEQVTDAVRQTLADEGLEQASEDHKLRLAMAAKIEYKDIPLKADQPLKFEVKVEIVPEFTLEGYRGVEVERPAGKVTDDDVAAALQNFRRRHGKFEKLEEGQVQEGDVPMCHALAIQDGQEIWRENELGAFLAQETIAGIPVPGLREAMIGAAVGDTKSFQAKLPDTFRAEQHRGKEVTLEVTVDELRRLVLPEATDEWAKSLRFDDLKDLREELRDELRRSREHEADQAVHARVAEKLLEKTSFDVPEGMVERLVTQARERRRLALLYRGEAPDDIEAQLTAQDQEARDASIRQCKLYFIYDRIAEQEKIFVTEDEVTQRIQAIALNYRRRPEDVASELEREGRLSALRHEMREEKVRDFLVQNAKVTQAADEAAAPAEPEKAAEAKEDA